MACETWANYSISANADHLVVVCEGYGPTPIAEAKCCVRILQRFPAGHKSQSVLGDPELHRHEASQLGNLHEPALESSKCLIIHWQEAMHAAGPSGGYRR